MPKGKKEYDVKTRFIFEGTFIVKASSQEQADEYVEKHCGLVLGGGIHSSLPDGEINWSFPVHPTKEILSTEAL